MLDSVQKHSSPVESRERSQTAYVFALAHLLPVSQNVARKLFEVVPTLESWSSLDDQQMDSLNRIPRNAVETLRTRNWDKMIEKAFEMLDLHKSRGIQVISILNNSYPPLLRLIDDPPLILFVKGNMRACADLPAVAIIGTRNVTPSGEKVATKIAAYFSEKGFSIISGLAKGIDTAAHRGAVQVSMPTVAVFATPLDKVYPAENRDLAESILETGGAWVSEIPLMKAVHRNSFVERDRIQSGLSSAVIPVQTDIKGGTMHTVNFAEKQGRLLFCPEPIRPEQDREQYRGILQLISSHRARQFNSDDYSDVAAQITLHFQHLKDRSSSQSGAPSEATPVTIQSALDFEVNARMSSRIADEIRFHETLQTLKELTSGRSDGEIRELIDLVKSELLSGRQTI